MIVWYRMQTGLDNMLLRHMSEVREAIKSNSLTNDDGEASCMRLYDLERNIRGNRNE